MDSGEQSSVVTAEERASGASPAAERDTTIPDSPRLPAVETFQQTHTTGDACAGITGAHFPVDEAFFTQLEQMLRVCQNAPVPLSQVRTQAAPVWITSGDFDRASLTEQELVVEPDGNFWFTARHDFSDERTQTLPINAHALVNAYTNAVRAGKQVMTGGYFDEAYAEALFKMDADDAPVSVRAPAPAM